MSEIDFKKIDKALDEIPHDTGTVETGNTFRVAYAALKAGYAVRRASWLGYWVRVGEDVVIGRRVPLRPYSRDPVLPRDVNDNSHLFPSLTVYISCKCG